MSDEQNFTAFSGQSCIAAGPLVQLLPALKQRFDAGEDEMVLVFADATGAQVDFDLRGTLDEVLHRALPAPARSGPGRPKLGVVSREVTLLPRHWQWLEAQPQGASAALRRLIEAARTQESPSDRVRQTQEAVGRVLTALAGNLPGYEEATRALWAKDRIRLEALISAWPADLRDYLLRLLWESF